MLVRLVVPMTAAVKLAPASVALSRNVPLKSAEVRFCEVKSIAGKLESMSLMPVRSREM